MVEIRKLQKSEWPMLNGIGDKFSPDPDSSVVVGAFDEGKMVGRIMLLAPVHVEGVWIDQEYRGKDLLKRLVDAAEEQAGTYGAKRLLAFGATDKMTEYITRLGYKVMPLMVCFKDLPEGEN